MDLEQASDELYGVAPEDFIARRTALVAEARGARDRDLAKAIGALRKPTKSAWLVNLLAREAGDEVAELLAIADALRSAQAGRAGADVRRLSAERRRVVDGLVSRVAELAAQHGHPANDATLQEVALTLQVGLADEEAAALVRAGRLTGAVSVAGFGGWGLESAAPAGADGTEAPEGSEAWAGAPGPLGSDGLVESEGLVGSGGTADRAATAAGAPESAAARAARLSAEARDAEAARLAARIAAAEQELGDAQAAAETAAERVEGLRTELAAAETAAADAASRLDAALRHLVDLGAPPAAG